MYMTIAEVTRKLTALLKEADVRGDLLVTNATVADTNDSNGLLQEGFAPGTVIFECIDSMDKDRVYQIWVNPDSVNELLN